MISLIALGVGAAGVLALFAAVRFVAGKLLDLNTRGRGW